MDFFSFSGLDRIRILKANAARQFPVRITRLVRLGRTCRYIGDNLCKWISHLCRGPVRRFQVSSGDSSEGCPKISIEMLPAFVFSPKPSTSIDLSQNSKIHRDYQILRVPSSVLSIYIFFITNCHSHIPTYWLSISLKIQKSINHLEVPSSILSTYAFSITN